MVLAQQRRMSLSGKPIAAADELMEAVVPFPESPLPVRNVAFTLLR
jgi:hypothetical protein